MKLRFVIWGLLVFSVWCFGGSRGTAAELKAGVARIDLTPPQSLKAPLGGYGARMNRPAEGVHDRIFAKALVITDGTTKFALVTADMLGFSPPMKQAVIDRLASKGWATEQIMLLASHSHTSIEMNAINPTNSFQVSQIGIHNPKLYEFTVSNFAKVIEQAEQKLVPVTIGSTSLQIPGWNRNRRKRTGITDDELTITRIDTHDGKPFAVLVNFTAHPTFMSAKNMMFSGGWPGHLQRTLESLIGDDVTAMYFNGAEGDQAPVTRPNSGSSRWERAESYGRNLAVMTWKLWRNIVTARDVEFASYRQEITLPARRWHPDFMKTGGTEYGLTEELLKEMLPRMFPTKTASGVLRLGELVIVGVPGEMAAELGLKIKTETSRLTGARHAVIGGLADEWISYILPEKAYETGGYESSVSFYGPKLADRIVTGALTGVKRLKP